MTTVASRTTKTRYPSGDVPPSCDAVVFGRTTTPSEGADCSKLGIGPRLYTESEADVSPSGVVALHGSLSEWVRDTPEDYTSACWRDASYVDPVCTKAGNSNRVIRGGSWATPPIRGTFRFFNDYLEAGAGVGFRCAYAAEAP